MGGRGREVSYSAISTVIVRLSVCLGQGMCFDGCTLIRLEKEMSDIERI